MTSSTNHSSHLLTKTLPLNYTGDWSATSHPRLGTRKKHQLSEVKPIVQPKKRSAPPPPKTSRKKKPRKVNGEQDDKSYDVECILDKRRDEYNNWEWYVRWSGYPTSENLWIRRSRFDDVSKGSLFDKFEQKWKRERAAAERKNALLNSKKLIESCVAKRERQPTCPLLSPADAVNSPQENVSGSLSSVALEIPVISTQRPQVAAAATDDDKSEIFFGNPQLATDSNFNRSRRQLKRRQTKDFWYYEETRLPPKKPRVVVPVAITATGAVRTTKLDLARSETAAYNACVDGVTNLPIVETALDPAAPPARKRPRLLTQPRIAVEHNEALEIIVDKRHTAKDYDSDFDGGDDPFSVRRKCLEKCRVFLPQHHSNCTSADAALSQFITSQHEKKKAEKEEKDDKQEKARVGSGVQGNDSDPDENDEEGSGSDADTDESDGEVEEQSDEDEEVRDGDDEDEVSNNGRLKSPFGSSTAYRRQREAKLFYLSDNEDEEI